MAEAQQHEQDEATATEEVRQQRSLISKVYIYIYIYIYTFSNNLQELQTNAGNVCAQ